MLIPAYLLFVRSSPALLSDGHLRAEPVDLDVDFEFTLNPLDGTVVPASRSSSDSWIRFWLKGKKNPYLVIFHSKLRNNAMLRLMSV